MSESQPELPPLGDETAEDGKRMAEATQDFYNKLRQAKPKQPDKSSE